MQGIFFFLSAGIYLGAKTCGGLHTLRVNLQLVWIIHAPRGQVTRSDRVAYAGDFGGCWGCAGPFSAGDVDDQGQQQLDIAVVIVKVQFQ